MSKFDYKIWNFEKNMQNIDIFERLWISGNNNQHPQNKSIILMYGSLYWYTHIYLSSMQAKDKNEVKWSFSLGNQVVAMVTTFVDFA